MRSNEDRLLSSQETTDTILEYVQTHSPDNLVVHVDGARYLIPVQAVKLLAWNSVPPFIRDEDSGEAKKNQTLRTGLKALIRPFLPEIIKKSWGREVRIIPRMNILNWLPRYLIHILINAVAFMEWHIDVEKCSDCQEATYKVTRISPNTDHVVRAEQIPTTQTDPESVSGGGQSDSSGETNNNQSRGSVGGRWRSQKWQIDLGPGAAP